MSRNIIVSSWPASGGSTQAFFLATLLDYKYVYAGWVLKYFAKEIFGDDSGNPFMQFENEFGNYWDDLWEAYAQKMLAEETNMLMEGMTAGFLYGNHSNYGIYYIASVEARAARAHTDARSNPEETIRRRDTEVRQRWIENLHIDIYDLELIKEKYDLLVDSSEMSITETLLYTIRHMNESGFNIQLNHQQAAEMEDHYWRNGKQEFHKGLAEKGLLWDPAHVFADWQEMFPEQVKLLPNEMKDIVRA